MSFGVLCIFKVLRCSCFSRKLVVGFYDFGVKKRNSASKNAI